MKKYQAKDLISSYVKKETTPQEDALIEQGFLNDLQNSDHLPGKFKIRQADKRMSANLARHIYYQKTGGKIRSLRSRIAVAASILLALTMGVSFFLYKYNAPPRSAMIVKHDIIPGNKKAYLTLANGKTIILNNTISGRLANQGTIVINKMPNGEVAYKAEIKPGSVARTVTYNAITVPAGAEYQIVTLPDGTKVWINSLSSLRYPTTFDGTVRKVELKGEAYFEVAHDPAKPFRVISEQQTVEVLGTHFNINAYSDEPGVKTTLIEGKVKIISNLTSHSQLLAPGQQSFFAGDNFTVKTVDTEQSVAWTNGKFSFEGQHIDAIMRTISRWYNVEIIYRGQIPQDTFGGEISRFANVTSVLNILQLTGKVQFKIEDGKIIVSKPSI